MARTETRNIQRDPTPTLAETLAAADEARRREQGRAEQAAAAYAAAMAKALTAGPVSPIIWRETVRITARSQDSIAIEERVDGDGAQSCRLVHGVTALGSVGDPEWSPMTLWMDDAAARHLHYAGAYAWARAKADAAVASACAYARAHGWATPLDREPAEVRP